MELKKILIEKMEGNKSIQRSDEQRNLYKALVEAYDADKAILDTYGESTILKRRREDDDQEGPSTGSDRGLKDKEKEGSMHQLALHLKQLPECRQIYHRVMTECFGVVETKASADVDENDGFTQVTRKGGKGKQEGKGKQVAGIRLSKPKPNMVYQVVHKPPNNNDGTSSSTKNDDVQPPKPPAIPSNEEDEDEHEDEEVKEVFNEEESWKSKNNMEARTPFNKNLLTHKHYMHNRPWCLLRDFNVSLFVDEKSTGSSFIDTGMRDFQDYVDVIEMSDVNSTRLRFTWNQKPKGDNGVLKKTDRIMANIEFYTSFVGSSAIFQPYRISDHSMAVLRVLMISHIKPCPFKFSNILSLGRKIPMQKAKVEWLKLGDSKLDYFHKVVKSQATRNQIDSITTTHGINVDRDQAPLAFIDHYSKFVGYQGANSNLNNTKLFHTQLSNDVATYMVREVSD
uniref:RNA-directed DNA polymerase, eukaryota, reverse transcriptase zinc-binding domain protein n=1 Tax=Tanacetum cinerariifolium TaxID=118510 RepID=A0A6L2NEV3_TANCI|nr:RNA-directed DNA polymerase, eukaryota, reverse transcriptase zinc-binding domain protein [Tanacetum cinerariifolium]